MRRTALTALAALIGLLIASPAHATPLPPGTTVTPLATVNPLTTLGNSIVDHISGTASATGTNGKTLNVSYDVWVVRVGAGDLALTDKGLQAVGDLDFVYQFKNLGTSSTVVDTTTHDSFANWGLGADYSANGLNQVTPETANRTFDGATPKFSFFSHGEVNPGQMSTLNILETTATSYKVGNYTFQDGVTVQVSAFAPGPEPSSMVLAGLGAIGLVGYGIRRRKARTA